MNEVWNTLQAPATFEEMSLVVRNREILRQAREFLDSEGVEIRVKYLLAAWVIHRFPETILNTQDMALLSAAGLIVRTCTQNEPVEEVLESFVDKLETWKMEDANSLSDELVVAYDATFSDPAIRDAESREEIEKTRSTILQQARKIGGDELASRLLSAHK